jgi:hypothetical protein
VYGHSGHASQLSPCFFALQRGVLPADYDEALDEAEFLNDLATTSARARKKFAEFDANHDGVIDKDEAVALAEWVWSSFHPGGQPLSEVEKVTEVRACVRACVRVCQECVRACVRAKNA